MAYTHTHKPIHEEIHEVQVRKDTLFYVAVSFILLLVLTPVVLYLYNVISDVNFKIILGLIFLAALSNAVYKGLHYFFTKFDGRPSENL